MDIGRLSSMALMALLSVEGAGAFIMGSSMAELVGLLTEVEVEIMSGALAFG